MMGMAAHPGGTECSAQFGAVVGEHDTGFLGRFGILPERVKVHEACLMRRHHHVAPLRKAGRVQAP